MNKIRLTIIVLLAFLLAACTLPQREGQVGVLLKPEPTEKAQVVFIVYYPVPLEEGESLELVIIDEVTGVPFNQKRLALVATEQENQYAAYFSAPVGASIFYRYEKVINGSRLVEYNYAREPVDMRLYVVNGPGKEYDQIAGFDAKFGEIKNPAYITGKVVLEDTGIPLSDILVFCEGFKTVTDANGAFTIYPIVLPAYGTHEIFVYAKNGAYLASSQQVDIQMGLSTPVEMPMTPASWKHVTFTVTVPEDTIDGAPIRIAGNLAQLGGTYQDLGGGITGDVHNMPVLVKNEFGRYTASMDLPAGVDIRYKYTLGDGFWNAEHGIDQNFVVHQVIIPASSNDVYIHDTVHSWKSSPTETIWFQATTPENTPEDESIGLQFQLADWMPPLPMFKVEDGRWAFPILSPHNFYGAISYRYCRNGPCTGEYQPGVETLAMPRGSTTQYQAVELITDEITGWITLEEGMDALVSDQVPVARDENFLAGMTISPYYSLTSQPFMDISVRSMADYANLVVFSPAWVAQDPGLPGMFSPDASQTQMVFDTIEGLELANDLDLQAGVFPQVFFEGGAEAWWQAANTHDESWWEQWIEQYQSFLNQYAELARKSESDVLIIGGDWTYYAMPVGDNFSTYHQPGNIEEIWRETIEEAKELFGGVVAIQVPVEMLPDFPLSILSSVDQLYVQWDMPIDHSGDDVSLRDQIGTTLDDTVKMFNSSADMPVVIVLAYPSAEGFANGCIPSRVEPDSCLDAVPLLYGPSQQIQAVTDLNIQTEFYLAALEAINERPWIHGVISQGYYPAIEMHDPSASIHGKPAEDLLATWYLDFLGK